MVLEQSSALLLCGSHSWPGVEPGTVLRGPALALCPKFFTSGLYCYLPE